MSDTIPGFPDLTIETNRPLSSEPDEHVTLTGRLTLEDALDLHDYSTDCEKAAPDWRAGVMFSMLIGFIGLCGVFATIFGPRREFVLGFLSLVFLAWGIFWPWGANILARKCAKQKYLAEEYRYRECTAVIETQFISLSSENYSYDLRPQFITAIINRPGGLVFLGPMSQDVFFYLPRRDMNDDMRAKILRIATTAQIPIYVSHLARSRLYTD